MSGASQTALFWAVAATMVVIRYVVFASDGAPPTIDAGNWLAFGDSLLGGDVRDSSISYPPVVPAGVSAAVGIFGLTGGVSLFASLSAIAPGCGVFHALGRLEFGRSRLFPALALLGVGSVGEAASWGGFPQLIAMGLLPIVVVLVSEFVEAPGRATSLMAGSAVMLMLATSHFVAPVAVVAGVVLVGVKVVAMRSAAPLVAVLRWLPLLILPSIWLVGTYIDLIDAVFVDPNPFSDLDNLSTSNFFDRLEGIYVDAPILWRVLVPLTVVSPFISWSSGRSSLVGVVRAMFVALAFVVIITREGRYLYLIPTLSMLSVALWLAEAQRRGVRIDRGGFRQTALVGVAGLVIVAQMFAGIRQLDNQRYFYTAMSPGLVLAIDAARSNTTPDEVVAIPSVRGAPVGWWVEALAARKVVYGSPLRWLNFSDEVRRATVANEIFMPDFPTDERDELLDAAGVAVVILPRAWEWLELDEVLAWVEAKGHAMVLINGDALVLRVR